MPSELPVANGPGRQSRRRIPVGIVDRVLADSPADLAGVLPGDSLLAVNGLVPRDVIDVRLDAATSSVELDVERAGTRLVLAASKEPDEDLGIEFASPAFDRMKTCNNACEFCFIRGLPPGLRRSLYIKDDDFRYSFLYGNFTTLTNLTPAEWQRIIFERLSPLHVSVHATDLALRREILANPKAPDILEQIDELGPQGIRIHAQIVLMPGRNDGAALEKTIADLAARYPSVESAAVVPVGLTRHSRTTIRALEKADAEAAIRTVLAVQRRCRKEWGVGFVYASDELYLLAGRPLPSPASYDDYPQFQNGVGLVQLFRAEWKRAAKRLPAAVDPPRRVCWATGPLLAPLLRALSEDLSVVDGLTVDVVPVDNSLFGGAVTIAGLMSGQDVATALTDHPCDRLLLPRSMFDTAAGLRTIDGWTVDHIAERLGVDVVIGASPRDLLTKTLEMPAARPRGSVEGVTTNDSFGAEGELTCAGS